MNKSEIQERIEKCESELAALKVDLAKCDCAEGIEQEKCWHAIFPNGDCSVRSRTREDCQSYWQGGVTNGRAAYMPECRQVTAEDAQNAWSAMNAAKPWGHQARELHKLGFRMKVTP